MDTNPHDFEMTVLAVRLAIRPKKDYGMSYWNI